MHPLSNAGFMVTHPDTILWVLVVIVILKLLMNKAGESDARHNRGTPEMRAQAEKDGNGVIILIVVVLLFFMFFMADTSQYKSTGESIGEFVEIIKQGSFDNFRK